MTGPDLIRFLDAQDQIYQQCFAHCKSLIVLAISNASNAVVVS
jgi:hypothetical protein